MALLSIIPVSTLGALTSFTYNDSYILGSEVPDNDPTGFSDTRLIDASEITDIHSVTVDLTLSDGWLGDIYAYVSHDSGFTVLLNRIGRSDSSSLGSSASNLDVTFMDGGPDIHTAGGPYSGIFGPDARETDPANTLDTDPQTADFSSFAGLPASGEWTLFIADVGAGEITRVESWSLSITGVPEPSATMLVFALAALAIVGARKIRSHGKTN